jgi:lipopolysaccharide export system protein LptA
MRKCFILFFSIISANVLAEDKADPFSKITIKSSCATFKKAANNKDLYCLQYKDNVLVKFADDSTISAAVMSIFFKKDKTKEIQKIVLKKNVVLKRPDQEAIADLAEIFVSDKLCKLKGNISITQKGNGKKVVPLKTTCSSARFKWGERELLLLGSRSKPVDTVIELADALKHRVFKRKSSINDKKTDECHKNTFGSGSQKNSSG